MPTWLQIVIVIFGTGMIAGLGALLKTAFDLGKNWGKLIQRIDGIEEIFTNHITVIEEKISCLERKLLRRMKKNGK